MKSLLFCLGDFREEFFYFTVELCKVIAAALKMVLSPNSSEKGDKLLTELWSKNSELGELKIILVGFTV
jgi:hypothetical protein